MLEVRRSTGCGNSPKNRFAEDYVIALLTGDVATLERLGTWPLGDEHIPAQVPSEIAIEHVVTHGKVGAVNGTVTTNDAAPVGFCFMLVFTNVKAERVAKVTRYSS